MPNDGDLLDLLLDRVADAGLQCNYDYAKRARFIKVISHGPKRACISPHKSNKNGWEEILATVPATHELY